MAFYLLDQTKPPGEQENFPQDDTQVDKHLDPIVDESLAKDELPGWDGYKASH